jgi:tetratricopeptide (TPR) repeat protein
MAKTRRVSKPRTSARKPAQKSKRAKTARSGSARHATSRSSAKNSRNSRPSRKATKPPLTTVTRPSPRTVAQQTIAPPLEPPQPPKKPTYHEAVSLYERGLQALQRRDFAAAAEALRNVIARYPDERELLERARLYLKVCERELEPRDQAPKTADDWVYAATVALNSADEPAALHHLTRALESNPRHDHAHYMMAVATARRSEPGRALEHLRQAVALNAENRSLAKQDPELDSLRGLAAFADALEARAVTTTATAPGAAPARARKTRR